MDTIRIGSCEVSRFILGSNPFSGFSHQSSQVDLDMKRYYTTARVKETFYQAESLGVNTFIARTDQHVMRLFLEYADEGGALQWFAQTCPEVGSSEVCARRAQSGGARACHIHGGVMDYLLAQGKLAEVPPAIEQIRSMGMLAGIAGHNPAVFEWADENLDVDYYLCCYYNSASRSERAEHVSGMTEWFRDEDRQIMTQLIPKLSRPVVHYKILAAGRNDPAEAFDVAARTMRPNDTVCVGVYSKDASSMLGDDVRMFEEALERRKNATARCDTSLSHESTRG